MCITNGWIILSLVSLDFRRPIPTTYFGGVLDFMVNSLTRARLLRVILRSAAQVDYRRSGAEVGFGNYPRNNAALVIN